MAFSLFLFYFLYLTFENKTEFITTMTKKVRGKYIFYKKEEVNGN